jgi:cyanophycinase
MELIIKEACPSPKGILLIIGGKEDKGDTGEDKSSQEEFFPKEILKEFIALTGKEKPLVEVVTSGSSVGEEVFDEYRKIFSAMDVDEIMHMHHNRRDEINSNELIKRANKADAFFFTGGDQLLLTSLYGGTEFLSALKTKYINEPLVIAGTSAGAMALSTPMIYAGSKEVEQIGGEIKVTTGLEFLRDVCIDTHFVHRGRFVRMAQVIATNPTCLGIGIDEDTAIVVKNGFEATVLGSGVIIVIEGWNLTQTNMREFNQGKLVSLRDMRVHILSKDDQYQIKIKNPPHK